METWFVKSIVATVTIVPAFIAIPFFKFKFGIDPLVFLVWYFGAIAVAIAVYLGMGGRGDELVPPMPQLAVIIAIGIVFGALANGSLFQAIGLAPNPGLPPVIYASSSLVVFFLSAVLAGSFPALFKPANFELSRMTGIILVIAGLYLLAGGRIGNPFRSMA
ncbi:MAG: hypothetical protein HOH61_12215 [Rhodospirillaceae bacterium]|jgi:hypothetical protein|nr:hypothetical protein [Rhodospirillaceae bacterium]